MGFVTFVIFLIIAIGCAFAGAMVLSRSVPGGFLSTTIIGFLGAWFGSVTLIHLGPDIGGVSIVASAICSGIFVMFFFMVTGGRTHTWD